MGKLKKPNGRPKTYKNNVVLTQFRMPIPTECLEEVKEQIKLITNKHLLYPNEFLNEKNIFENKVNEIQNYFREKISKNDFEITDISGISFSILINNVFVFRFLYNFDDGKNYIWETEPSFMFLNISKKDFETIYINNKEYILRNLKNKLILEKEQELEKIKNL